MNFLLVAPLVLTIGGIGVGRLLPRLVAPSTSARMLTAVVVSAAAGITAGLVLLVMAGSSKVHAVSEAAGWCQALYPGDHGAAPWVAVVAGSLLAIAVTRGVRYHRRARAERALYADIDGVEILATDQPVAFAVPGRPGGIVIGSALLHRLDPNERRVLLAHENAHLRLRHHLYVQLSELGAAAYPFLVPLSRQVRFATERWADEIAAEEIGSRRIVAQAIARVALFSHDAAPTPALGFSDSGTIDRVEALLHPTPPRRGELALGASIATMAATLTGSSAQIHHLALFLYHARPM